MKEIWISFRSKPVEFICATAMIATGIAIAAKLEVPAWQALGCALSALGGALFSYSASVLDTKEKARQVLKSELQITTRHLADVAGKISRTVQGGHTGEIDSDKALDRISQFTSSLYVS